MDAEGVLVCASVYIGVLVHSCTHLCVKQGEIGCGFEVTGTPLTRYGRCPRFKKYDEKGVGEALNQMPKRPKERRYNQ